ncbi:hypothetical protein GALMADRAFT_1126147 [Galerina marginata CBS 339.88]|uniref:Uncharacterized protein n=1 Tax=Galerina marginata (strain CBS 339.88) TaxID=685588 RepID=A0A067SB87_GALM3|nr:hypothetical protein GALMADRAFT_1126147 [Galerina marginata CBS 339.88]
MNAPSEFNRWLYRSRPPLVSFKSSGACYSFFLSSSYLLPLIIRSSVLILLPILRITCE